MNNYLIRYTNTARVRSRLAFILFGFLLISFAIPTFAATSGETNQIDWLKLSMGLFGGLAMFLFGMEQMSDGLKSAAGDTLKDVLARLTKNRFMGANIGSTVTAQSVAFSVTQ